MNVAEQKRALAVAIAAAHVAGELMVRNARSPKVIKDESQHDIKLELDVRCQKRIESLLRKAFPEVSILGEEGIAGDSNAPYRWVVDPIDGTVNFCYGIPHACVSIALQARVAREQPPKKTGAKKTIRPAAPSPEFVTLVGVVYDPFCNEMFSARRGDKARLNGRVIRVSTRTRLDEAIVSLGFAKTKASLDYMYPILGRLTHRVRKIRIFGAAAISLAWIAAGRMDAYVETGLRLWDIAAGGLILECAGGDFFHAPVSGEPHSYRILVSNGHLRRALEKLCPPPPA